MVLSSSFCNDATISKEASVHYDKRTYSIKGDAVSLYTLEGRVVVPFVLGEHQKAPMAAGACKEAELVFRKGE